MPTRTETAQAAAQGLRTFAASIQDTPVLIGFDGFVDSIIDVVDTLANRTCSTFLFFLRPRKVEGSP